MQHDSVDFLDEVQEETVEEKTAEVLDNAFAGFTGVTPPSMMEEVISNDNVFAGFPGDRRA